MTPDASSNPDARKISELLADIPYVQLAVLFGSMARGTAKADSDIDVAVQANRELSADERIALVEALALAFNRPVDLIDLRTAGQPLLDQIVRTGIPVVGTQTLWGELIYRNIMDNEDFVPYQQRILSGRRNAWINNS